MISLYPRAGSRTEISNNFFVDNDKRSGTASILRLSSSSSYQGEVYVTNNTFSSNTNFNSLFYASSALPSDIYVKNSIFWNNGNSGLFPNGINGQAVFENNISESNPPSFTNINNIITDPAFQPGSYSLGLSSPAVDAGIDEDATSTDFKGSPRFDVPGIGASNTSSDIGADELVPQTGSVWADSAPAATWENEGWDWALGFHFTPQKSGLITALGGRFVGAKTVKIFNRDTLALLAEAVVNSDNTFSSYTPITPLAVDPATNYTIAVYMAGSGGSGSQSPPGTFPLTANNITIHGTTFVDTSSNADSIPTTIETYGYMWGEPDFQFTVTEDPNNPTDTDGDGVPDYSDIAINDPDLNWGGYRFRPTFKSYVLPSLDQYDTPVDLNNLGDVLYADRVVTKDGPTYTLPQNLLTRSYRKYDSQNSVLDSDSANYESHIARIITDKRTVVGTSGPDSSFADDRFRDVGGVIWPSGGASSPFAINARLIGDSYDYWAPHDVLARVDEHNLLVEEHAGVANDGWSVIPQRFVNGGGERQ